MGALTMPETTPTAKPIDFAKVEALRKHMLLTMDNMAELCRVSRVTYSKWVEAAEAGKTTRLRKANDATVRATLKTLLDIMVSHDWPMPEVIAAEQARRYTMLLALLPKADEPTAD